MKAKTAGLEARVVALEAELEKLKVKMRWLGDTPPQPWPYRPTITGTTGGASGETVVFPVHWDIPPGFPINSPLLYPVTNTHGR